MASRREAFASSYRQVIVRAPAQLPDHCSMATQTVSWGRVLGSRSLAGLGASDLINCFDLPPNPPMGPTPLIFVSTTSQDLAAVRREMAATLQKAACRPILMDVFPPEYGTACEMLEREIDKCDAVIHVAGMRFGSMPQDRNDKPRSYTQIEYDCARRLKKRVFVFLLPEEFPYDTCLLEEQALKDLQAAHRTDLNQLDNRNSAKDVSELATKIALIGGRIRWEQALKYVLRKVSLIILALILMAALGWLLWADYKFRKLRSKLVSITRDVVVKGTTPDTEIGNYAEELGISQGDAAAEIRLALANAQLTFRPDALARPLASYFDKRYAEAGKQAENAAIAFEKRMSADPPHNPVNRNSAIDAFRLAADAYRLVNSRTDELRNREKIIALLAGDFPNEPLESRRAEWLEAASRLAWARWLIESTSTARNLADLTVERFESWSSAGGDSSKGLSKLLALELRNTRSLIAWSQGDGRVFLTDSEIIFNLAKAEYGDDDGRTLSASNNLALAYSANNMLEKCNEMEEWTIRGLERTKPSDDPFLLQAKLNHAVTLQQLGRLEEALALSDALLEPFERISGKSHPATFNNRHNRANTLLLLGRLAEAESAHRLLLVDRLDKLGAGNLDTWKSKLALAQVLRRRKSYEEAKTLVEAVITDCSLAHETAVPECQNAELLRSNIIRDKEKDGPQIPFRND